MFEVKERTTEMLLLLNATTLNMRPRTRFELLYFHVRMICEFIALGCLVCHDTAPNKTMSRFSDKYRADAILKMLTRDSPLHYPQAIENVPKPVGYAELIPLDPQPLPPSKLWSLYTKADKMLHVGHVRDTLKNVFHEYDERYLRDFQVAVVEHLNCHKIHLTGMDRFLYVIMENGKGEIGWNIFNEIPSDQTSHTPPNTHQ